MEKLQKEVKKKMKVSDVLSLGLIDGSECIDIRTKDYRLLATSNYENGHHYIDRHVMKYADHDVCEFKYTISSQYIFLTIIVKLFSGGK